MSVGVSDGELANALLCQGIEVERELGRGGTGVVLAARWQGRAVAVKVGLDGAGSLVAPPEHPSILGHLAAGTALGRSYAVLERFPCDLGRLLAGRPLRRDLLRPVLLSVLDALAFAHRRGVVHGDVKPANVLVDAAARPARVALADFGGGAPAGRGAAGVLVSLSSADVAGLRASGAVGTLPYLAPERLDGGAATPASDVYALGVLLFEVLTGRRPVGIELPSELVAGLDRRLDAVVKAAVHRDPAARPANVEALRRELLRCLPGPDAAGDDAAGEGGAVEIRGVGGNMLQIVGGYLVIGDRDDPDARPMHEVRLPDFWIDVTPVTNRAYAAFVRATRARPPAAWPRRGGLAPALAELPVSGVTWHEARAFAAWAKKRLPTEYEWERAAQGPEQRRFPYGDERDLRRLPPDPTRLWPVGTHSAGATSEGVQDLTGNGWQWTGSLFCPYGGASPAPSDPSWPRVVRGGFDPRRGRSGSATFRLGLRPDARDPLVTFRCARDA